MTSAPSFQWYPRDWVMSTRVLTPEQRGVYFDLLCFAWDGDGLPESLSDIAAMAGVSTAKFKRLWTVLEDRFEQDEWGRWRNPRQEKQRAELAAHRKQKSDAGKASAAKRAQQNGNG